MNQQIISEELVRKILSSTIFLPESVVTLSPRTENSNNMISYPRWLTENIISRSLPYMEHGYDLHSSTEQQ